MEVRRVEVWMEVDGELRKMVFLTNNIDWSPVTVCDLYRRRWDIEVFFKQVKQCLKLAYNSFQASSIGTGFLYRTRGNDSVTLLLPYDGRDEIFQGIQSVWVQLGLSFLNAGGHHSQIRSRFLPGSQQEMEWG